MEAVNQPLAAAAERFSYGCFDTGYPGHFQWLLKIMNDRETFADWLWQFSMALVKNRVWDLSGLEQIDR
eukprot:6485887-Amphidinium_carterae.1